VLLAAVLEVRFMPCNRLLPALQLVMYSQCRRKMRCCGLLMRVGPRSTGKVFRREAEIMIQQLVRADAPKLPGVVKVQDLSGSSSG
jgi:hypothetical protein